MCTVCVHYVHVYVITDDIALVYHFCCKTMASDGEPPPSTVSSKSSQYYPEGQQHECGSTSKPENDKSTYSYNFF